jgi:hypothetical protein
MTAYAGVLRRRFGDLDGLICFRAKDLRIGDKVSMNDRKDSTENFRLVIVNGFSGPLA